MFAAKQAECVITGVSYTYGSNPQLHSVEVQMFNDDGDLSKPIIWSRQKLLHAIKTFDVGFVTAAHTLGMSDHFYIGGKVDIVPLDGIEYIRTDGCYIPEDNLGDLPEF